MVFSVVRQAATLSAHETSWARSMNRTTKILIAGTVAFAAGIAAGNAFANDRYTPKGPIIVSPDLTAPWVLQLQQVPAGKLKKRPLLSRAYEASSAYVKPVQRQVFQPQPVQTAMVGTRQLRKMVQSNAQPKSAQQAEAMGKQVDDVWLPQNVEFETNQKPGSIIIDTNTKFLYFVLGDGQARRYGVGVGKPGFEWAGTHNVSRKAEWPEWRPPAEMIAREAKKGRNLPAYMEGGSENPLGARAMYLGSSMYRIHGTNQPWTIGKAVSSGCIRMRNEDVVDLYERVKIGAKVTVI
jgi:lipoprotein-anchoring transpeptidase ErfK/SrfK